MRLRIRRSFLTALTFFISATLSLPGQTAEVTIEHQQLTLSANLELAAGKTLADGVILITHGGLAHRGMEPIPYLQELMLSRSYSSLAINLSLGIDHRLGMYDCARSHRHRHEDAVEEIAVWVLWLQQQSVGRIVLLGHSRGGAQTALYASQARHEAIQAVVLMAPATRDNGGAGYERRYQQALAPTLKTAETLLKNQQGEQFLQPVNLLYCRDTQASAASFFSYYRDSDSLDTPSLLPDIPWPTLVLIAEEDAVVPNLASRIEALPPKVGIHVELIDGAGHFFRDLNADDAADVIDEFLSAQTQQ